MNAGLKIALFDEPEEEKTFIDESDKVAAMQVDILPDYTVSQEQMHEYGYTWDGMLPVRVRTARVLYGGCVPDLALGEAVQRLFENLHNRGRQQQVLYQYEECETGADLLV